MTNDDDCVDWVAQRGHFVPDGSLRDIYVPGTTVEDWDRVLQFVAREAQPALLTRNVDEREVPLEAADANRIFAEPCTHSLSLTVGGLDVRCYFFTVVEIEFDLDPNELTEDALRALVRFMAQLGRVTGKRVVLTFENMIDRPIFEYLPARDRVRFRG